MKEFETGDVVKVDTDEYEGYGENRANPFRVVIGISPDSQEDHKVYKCLRKSALSGTWYQESFFAGFLEKVGTVENIPTYSGNKTWDELGLERCD